MDAHFVHVYPQDKRSVPHLLDVQLGKTLCGREPSQSWKHDDMFVQTPRADTCYACYDAWSRHDKVEKWQHRYDEKAYSAEAW